MAGLIKQIVRFLELLEDSNKNQGISETSDVIIVASIFALSKFESIKIDISDIRFPTLNLPRLKELPKSKSQLGSNTRFEDEVEPSSLDGVSYKKLKSGGFAIGAQMRNPMNIRPSYDKKGKFRTNYWQGQTGVYRTKTSGAFVSFKDPFYSIRAAAIIINNYPKLYPDKLLKFGGKLTIRSMLNIYAPPSENDTEAYIRYVSEHSGIPADEEISMENENDFVGIIKAMAMMESQTVLSDEYLRNAHSKIFGPHVSSITTISINRSKGSLNNLQ